MKTQNFRKIFDRRIDTENVEHYIGKTAAIASSSAPSALDKYQYVTDQGTIPFQQDVLI